MVVLQELFKVWAPPRGSVALWRPVAWRASSACPARITGDTDQKVPSFDRDFEGEQSHVGNIDAVSWLCFKSCLKSGHHLGEVWRRGALCRGASSACPVQITGDRDQIIPSIDRDFAGEQSHVGDIDAVLQELFEEREAPQYVLIGQLYRNGRYRAMMQPTPHLRE